MCADSVNFGDYLVRNDKWLLENGETENTEAGDGELSDREISIFFSNSHINSDGNDEISADEFNNWYKNNESAISAYLNDIGADYDDPEVKAAMLESMNEYAQTKAEVELQHLNDEYDGTKLGDVDMPGAEEIDDEPTVDDSPTIEPTTPADPTTPTDPSTPDEPTTPEATPGEAPDNFNEAQKEFYDSYQTLASLKNSLPPEEYDAKVNNLMSNILNSYEIDTYKEKLSLIESMHDIEPTAIESYFESNDTLYKRLLNETIKDGDFSTDEVIELTKRYNELQGNNTFSSIDGNDVMKVYEKAKEEGKLQELLNSGFYSYKDAAELIQSDYKLGTETRLLKELLNIIGEGSPTKFEDYGLNEEQAKTLEKTYYKYTLFGNTKEKDSVKAILSAYKNGNLEKNNAKYLLQNLFGGDLNSLIDTFRALSNSNQKKYLEGLIEIYT